MGAFKYTITVESDAAPQILIGQNLGGATVVGSLPYRQLRKNTGH